VEKLLPMRNTVLKNHKLISIIVPFTTGYISRHDPDNRLMRLKPTKQEAIAIELLMSISNITDCIDQLHYIIQLLSGFRRKKGSIFNRTDYIVYTIENFYLRMTSIIDKCLILTNIVFDIGLPERDCKETTIIKNTKVNKTSVKVSLQKINKFIDHFKQIRNRIAHAEGFKDEKLDNLQGFYYLMDTEQSEDLQKFKHLFKTETDQYVNEKKEDLGKQIVTIEQLVDEFFTSLQSIAEMRITSANG